jgi:hypothetical protein
MQLFPARVTRIPLYTKKIAQVRDQPAAASAAQMRCAWNYLARFVLHITDILASCVQSVEDIWNGGVKYSA